MYIYLFYYAKPAFMPHITGYLHSQFIHIFLFPILIFIIKIQTPTRSQTHVNRRIYSPNLLRKRRIILKWHLASLQVLFLLVFLCLFIFCSVLIKDFVMHRFRFYSLSNARWFICFYNKCFVSEENRQANISKTWICWRTSVYLSSYNSYCCCLLIYLFLDFGYNTFYEFFVCVKVCVNVYMLKH